MAGWGGTCAILDLTVETSDRTRSGIYVCSDISACLRYLPVLAGYHRTSPTMRCPPDDSGRDGRISCY